MSTINEKDNTIGVTITRPSTVRDYSRNHVLSTIEDVDSTHTLTPTHGTFPASTVRDDSPARSLSYDNMKSESKTNISYYEHDVEACRSNSMTNALSPYSYGPSQQPCSMWPGRKQLKDNRKALKKTRGCQPLARFDKKTRIMIKIAIGLLLVGLIIGVGVGISKAVGGGIWNPSTHV